MNMLLSVARVARRMKRYRAVRSLAVQRYRQYEKKWANEKTTTLMVAIESTDESWFRNTL